MAFKSFLLASIMIGSVSASGSGDVSMVVVSSNTDLKEMEKVFARSDADHQRSIAAIMKDMTQKKAWQVLEKSNFTAAALMSLKTTLEGGQTSNLRKAAPEGYRGVEGARLMLNDMIYESMEKYDREISECTSFYSKQCHAMEGCRSLIDSSNYMSNEAAKVVAESQSRIRTCEEDIPETKEKLQQHLDRSSGELITMNAHLKVLEGDIDILTSILKMTECKVDDEEEPYVGIPKAGVSSELQLLRCEDACTKESFITFNRDDVQQKLNKLQSNVSRNLLQNAFQHDFEGTTSSKSARAVNAHVAAPQEPAPMVERPSSPCEDGGGAPSMNSKRGNKCSLAPPFPCDKLQERFLSIQSGLLDERSELLDTIQRYETYTKEMTETLEEQIKNDQAMLDEAGITLSGAMSRVSQANGVARTTEDQHQGLDKELKSKMNSCSQNYLNLENEQCALKKIRTELYKMKGSGHSANFIDCEVSTWQVGAKCTVDCGEGGVEGLVREVAISSSGGAKCLPLKQERSCNTQKCPIDCVQKGWGGWSKCTAECGGGTQRRLNEVVRAAVHGGVPCGAEAQERACNTQGCSKNCELGSWTQWSKCSKDCGIGTNKRERYVISPAEGRGKCPGKWSRKRLEYKLCHTHKCPKLTCANKLDVVLVLDGSGSMQGDGWNSQMVAAQNFVDSFNVAGTQAKMSVILYSGPSTYPGVYACTNGTITGLKDMTKKCRIETVVSMEDKKSDDMAEVKAALSELKKRTPRGSTLTSQALMRAMSEVNLGRPDAKSVVVVFTDGKPFSFRKTLQASHSVRKVSRLVYVPVVRYAPLKLFKGLASRRWQENIVPAKDFIELTRPRIVNDIIADICPTGEEKDSESKAE